MKNLSIVFALIGCIGLAASSPSMADANQMTVAALNQNKSTLAGQT